MEKLIGIRVDISHKSLVLGRSGLDAPSKPTALAEDGGAYWSAITYQGETIDIFRLMPTAPHVPTVSAADVRVDCARATIRVARTSISIKRHAPANANMGTVDLRAESVPHETG